MELEKYISEAIKRRKNELGMSRYKIAKQTGISYRHLLNVEAGTNITIKALDKLLSVLNLKLVIIPNDSAKFDSDQQATQQDTIIKE